MKDEVIRFLFTKKIVSMHFSTIRIKQNCEDIVSKSYQMRQNHPRRDINYFHKFLVIENNSKYSPVFHRISSLISKLLQQI